MAFTLQNLLEVAIAVVWAGLLATEIIPTGLGLCEGVRLLETELPHRKVLRRFFALALQFYVLFGNFAGS